MRNRIPGVVATALVVVFFAGCQQQQAAEAPNEKQARLLAAQSADLQTQLAARQAEIQTLREKHAQDLRQRDEELAQCKARIKTLEKDIETGIAERVSRVATAVVEENARLRKEIEQLKAEAQKQTQP